MVRHPGASFLLIVYTRKMLETCASMTFPDCQRQMEWSCCDRKSRAACAQSFVPSQQATIQIMHRNLSYYCLLAPRIYIVVLRSHPVRGESHNQRNATGEVATTSPPFYNESHRSHVLCVKAELGTTSIPWSQHHFVEIGNPEGHVRKVSHRGSKQQ